MIVPDWCLRLLLDELVKYRPTHIFFLGGFAMGNIPHYLKVIEDITGEAIHKPGLSEGAVRILADLDQDAQANCMWFHFRTNHTYVHYCTHCGVQSWHADGECMRCGTKHADNVILIPK